MELGAAQSNFAVDPRLPPQHARALGLLTSLVEASRAPQGSSPPANAATAPSAPKALYTVLKFIVKKEGLPPLARRIRSERAVPVYTQRRLLIKMCQAIERALSATLVVMATLQVMDEADTSTRRVCMAP
jgi:hypothetical protein